MKRREGFDPIQWARRHPFIVGSLALHGVLAGALWLAGPRAVVVAQRAQDLARVDATVRAAQREQVQRHLKRLEQLAKEAGAELPASAASSPLERATELTQRLEQAERQARTKELARLLKITPEAAAAKVRLEEARRIKSPPRDEAQALAQLERRARDVVERQRERERREREGHRVAGGVGVPGAQGATGSGGGPIAGGSSTRSVGGVGEPDRLYDAMVQAPPLDAPGLRFAEARRFGPGAPHANRVYLDRWYVTGPFPADNSRAMRIVYPPEIAVDLDGVYAGKHGVVGWRPQHSATYPFVPEPHVPDAIYYAATEVRVDRDMDVWLDIGADDDTKLWLNDEVVWVSGNGDKPWYHQAFYDLRADMARYGLVEGRVRVSLRAGRNTLLLKLYNAQDLMFFSVVIAVP